MVSLWMGLMELFLRNALTYGVVLNPTTLSFCTVLNDYRIVPYVMGQGVPPGSIVQIAYSVLDPDNYVILSEPLHIDDTYVTSLMKIRDSFKMMILMYPYCNQYVV